jgi:homopolymeric O-antigen transport system permease protein
VLVLFVLVAGERPEATWLIGIPALFVLQALLLIGCGQFVAAVHVLFRDLGPILDVGLTLAFYISPVIYPLDRVPERTRTLLSLNPLAPLLEAWRNLMVSGDLPGLDLWPTLLFTAIMLVVGRLVFRSLEKYFADAI